MTYSHRVIHLLQGVLERLIDPLRVDESIEQFTLSIPEAQTTTVDSVQGWRHRPPAVLRCPGCGGRLLQHEPIDDIECTDCWRTFNEDSFSTFDLLTMVCPRCRTDMTHGIRHPNVFDIPEYATCPECQYHWDLDHWY